MWNVYVAKKMSTTLSTTGNEQCRRISMNYKLRDFFSEGEVLIETYPKSNIFRREDHELGDTGIHIDLLSDGDRTFKELHSKNWKDHANFNPNKRVFEANWIEHD